ncbi:hypothetical protein LY76DRAFT_419530 [Colletotrichum caudatum]|nr:hypothetical protein LY76DRAFT_419530 [Colletotrichum caudatum]
MRWRKQRCAHVCTSRLCPRMSTTTGWMAVPYPDCGHCETTLSVTTHRGARASWFDSHLSPLVHHDARCHSLTLSCLKSHNGAGCLNGAVVLIVLPTPSEDSQSWALFLSFVHTRTAKESIEWAGKKTVWLTDGFPRRVWAGGTTKFNFSLPPPLMAGRIRRWAQIPRRLWLSSRLCLEFLPVPLEERNGERDGERHTMRELLSAGAARKHSPWAKMTIRQGGTK